MRIPFFRFMRLFGVLLLLFTTIMGVMISRAYAANPAPMCMLYYKLDDSGRDYNLHQADVRDGQTRQTFRDYYMLSTLSSFRLETSYSGTAAMSMLQSDYSESNTLYAGVAGSEKLRRLTQGIDMSGGWSPDGSRYAYLAHDDYYYASITITDRAGNRRRTRLIDTIGNASLSHFDGWSADGRYISVMTMTDDGYSYYFIDSATLGDILVMVWAHTDYPYSSGLFWAPQGHRFAYTENTGDEWYLVIATPEGGEEQRFALQRELELGMELPLRWSPDGRYVALHRYTDDAWDAAWAYATYSIFGVDGSAHTGIIGQQLALRSPSLVPEEQEPMDSWWSADSATWYFRQNAHDLAYHGKLMAYGVETEDYRTIVEDVAGAPVLLDGGRWFAIPVWEDAQRGTIKVELYASDGTQQSTLIAGAVRMPRVERATANDHYVAVRWQRMTEAGHLTAVLSWANADGSVRHTVDEDFDEIRQMQWLGDGRSLLYIARRGTAFFVEIVDLDTGESVFRLDELPLKAFGARVYTAPSGEQVVLVVGTLRQQYLYLIMLATKQGQLLEPSGIGLSNILWTTDSSAFAFMHYGTEEVNDTLRMISAEGVPLQAIDMQQPYERRLSARTLIDWSWCQ